jgi:polyhydroxybutyrate depolymerase
MRVAFIALLLGCSASESPAAVSDAAPETEAVDSEIVDTGTPIPDAEPTGGCGKTVPPGVTNNTITVGGVERKYVLSIPAGYDASKPYLLAFGWHGRTGNGALFKLYSGVEKAAGDKAIFVYPDGLPVTADPKDTGWVLTAAGRDIAFYDALLKELNDKVCVDSKRIVSFGHSFGGYMSNTVACFRPAVRAIAPVAGGGPFTACGSAVSAWIAHSTDDAVVNITEGQTSRDFWTKKAGCNTTTAKVAPEPCVAYEGCSVPVIWCQSPTGGHNWPSYAGAAIWSYFAGL